MRERIEDIFVSLGYAIEDDREIETDFYNFDALNIPENHPARAPQDTFYTTEGFALRSQTSTVQIHAMQRRGAPLRMIAPGRVFRRDTPDPTHNPMFSRLKDCALTASSSVCAPRDGPGTRAPRRGGARRNGNPAANISALSTMNDRTSSDPAWSRLTAGPTGSYRRQ